MDEWEEARVAQKGNGRKFHELLTPEDLEYHNAMVEWAEQAKPEVSGKLPRKWGEKDYWARERLHSIKKAFAERGEGRKEVRRMEDLGFDYVKWKNNAD